MKSKKMVAWGAGPLFELYIQHDETKQRPAYCIDSSVKLQGTVIGSVPIVSPEALDQENLDEVLIVITATSSVAIQAISAILSDRGFVLGKNYMDLANFLKDHFKKRAESVFKHKFSEENFIFARAFNFNSKTQLETTVLGNWLLLEALVATCHLDGAVAEIGAYQGGNAQLQLSAMTIRKDVRPYYVLDSFQGFPKLSKHDPIDQQNAYNIDYQVNRIFNALSLFEQTVVIPGFVPQTFEQIPKDQQFSVVFFDCDLYQPALDTYAFFWDRIQPGGILVIHDNVTPPQKWEGVRKATNEFFIPKGIQPSDFWETTMSVIWK